MRGVLAPARADFVSSELGLADTSATGGAQALALCFGGVKTRVHLLLDGTDKLGKKIPVHCQHKMGFERDVVH